MKNNQREKSIFAKIFYSLAEDFGGKVSGDRLELSFEAMNEYSIEDFSRGCSWLLKNRIEKFPAVPTTKEIIDAIKIYSGDCEDLKTIAEKQLDIVLKYLNHYGSDCDHVFKNNTTAYLMTNRWSFQTIGSMLANDFKWFKKEFVDAHIRMAETQSKQESFQVTHDANLSIPANNLKKLLGKK